MNVPFDLPGYGTIAFMRTVKCLAREMLLLMMLCSVFLASSAFGDPSSQPTTSATDPITVLQSVHIDPDLGCTVSGSATTVDDSSGKPVTSDISFSVLGQDISADISFNPQTAQNDAKWIDTPTVSFLYIPTSSYLGIEAPGSTAYAGQLGSDFRPRALVTIRGVFLRDALDGIISNIRKGHSTASVRMLQNGRIVVDTHYKVDPAGNELSSDSIEIDPSAGMRMTSFRSQQKNVNGKDSSDDCDFSLVWKKYDNQWFPESGNVTTNAVDVNQTTGEITQLHNHRSFKVNALDTAPKLSEEDFKLDALKVPLNTHISDHIRNIQYDYKERESR